MPDEVIAQLKVLLGVILLLALYIGPFIGASVIYLALSLPLRRKERGRLLLQLIDLGVSNGQSPERAITDAALSADPILGPRFYRVASLIKSGLLLDDALSRARDVVPPQITAMLRAGREVGDIRRVLPACRQALQDAVSQTRGAINFVAAPVLALIVIPVPVIVFIVTVVFVLPKFEQIARDMGVVTPWFVEAVLNIRWAFICIPIAIVILFQALVFFYVAGPNGWRLAATLGLRRTGERFLWLLPWRRNRLKRDFTAMLAALLDAGVEEARAVRLAGQSTANSLMEARADKIAQQLSAGARLTEALALLDDRAEVKWRVANAAHGGQGFVFALRGWLETLDAKAFQQEQAAAQVLTTLLVFVHGAFIGLFVTAVFAMLVSISEEAPLW